MIEILISVLCICSLIIILGAFIVQRSTDPFRDITIDYFLYTGICLASCCIIILTVPPLLFGYSFLNFFGLIQ